MQTLEHRAPPGPDSAAETRDRRRLRYAAGAAALVIFVAAVSYAIGASENGGTKIVKVTVAPTAAPKTPAARNCVPGAAPGSCNVDEFAESQIPDQPLDAATRAALAAQLVAARAAALRYPTVADAERAGFLQAGKFSPETGRTSSTSLT
jgi:hypothetical protein